MLFITHNGSHRIKNACFSSRPQCINLSPPATPLHFSNSQPLRGEKPTQYSLTRVTNKGKKVGGEKGTAAFPLFLVPVACSPTVPVSGLLSILFHLEQRTSRGWAQHTSQPPPGPSQKIQLKETPPWVRLKYEKGKKKKTRKRKR